MRVGQRRGRRWIDTSRDPVGPIRSDSPLEALRWTSAAISTAAAALAIRSPLRPATRLRPRLLPGRCRRRARCAGSEIERATRSLGDTGRSSKQRHARRDRGVLRWRRRRARHSGRRVSGRAGTPTGGRRRARKHGGRRRCAQRTGIPRRWRLRRLGDRDTRGGVSEASVDMCFAGGSAFVRARPAGELR
jgi:hypothetical protein